MFQKVKCINYFCIVPYTLCKIADGNGWKFLLLLIPFVNFVYAIMVIFRLAKSFGKGIGFGFGLLFLSPIFLLILAFGSASYSNPNNQGDKRRR